MAEREQQILGLCEAGPVPHGREQIACLGQGFLRAFLAERDQTPALAEECLGAAGEAAEVVPALGCPFVERERFGNAAVGLGEDGSRGDPGAPDAAEVDR